MSAQLLRIDWCTKEAARFACERWHYSHSTSAGKMVRVGVWESDKFIGCVLFSRGANNNIGAPYSLEQTAICELTRIALTKHVTPVSRIMSIAVRFVRKMCPGLRMLLSYADPAQGHHGGIYQAMGWLYAGPSQAQRQLIINGLPMHKRSATAAYGTASPEQITAQTGLHAAYGPLEWKHTYLLPLDAHMRAQVSGLRHPYPKRGPVDAGTER